MSITSNQSRLVPCPTCKNLSIFTQDNPFRPFCSQRCQLIDLGAWASESHRIPDTSPIEDLDESN